MTKLKTYIGIVLFSITFFSCANKNEWTPETEAQFKKDTKEELMKGEDAMTDEHATLMSNCMTEKIKNQNILPNDVDKSENEEKLTTIALDCAKETLTEK